MYGFNIKTVMEMKKIGQDRSVGAAVKGAGGIQRISWRSLSPVLKGLISLFLSGRTKGPPKW